MVNQKLPLPRLLVSVRCLEEAAIASSAKVDVIDFKEPSDGPLAAVDPSIWEAAAAAFPLATLSAALGESESAIRLSKCVPSAFRFAKVGPSGLQSSAALLRVWRSLDLSLGIELVPVAYADHSNADCLDVHRVLACVIATGRQRMLVDTFAKQGRTLTDHLSASELVELLHHARRSGIWVALAGSVRLPQVMELHDEGVFPDCWGVRGDVCCGGPDAVHRRQGKIDPKRIESWKQALQSHSQRDTA